MVPGAWFVLPKLERGMFVSICPNRLQNLTIDVGLPHLVLIFRVKKNGNHTGPAALVGS